MNGLTVAILILVLLNVLSFTMYILDKGKAVKGKHRTSERALLTISLLGPFGAAAGMSVARHKTKKLKFKVVYLFMVLHIAAIVFLVWYYYLR